MPGKPVPPDADDVAVFQAAADFRAALAQFHRRTAALCEKEGLTIDQYVILLMIKGDPSGDQTATITQLSRRLQLAHNGVTERVGRLEKSGLVTRSVSPLDQRMTDVRLTKMGDRLLTNAFWAVGEEGARLGEVTERANLTAWAFIGDPRARRKNRPDPRVRARGQRTTA